MNCTRARGRYLAALGLTGIHTALLSGLGCHGAEPTTTTAPTIALESAAPTATVTAPPSPPAPPTAAPKATAALKGPHTGPWVPTVEEETAPRRPGIGVCPHGPFCVPQPADPGGGAGAGAQPELRVHGGDPRRLRPAGAGAGQDAGGDVRRRPHHRRAGRRSRRLLLPVAHALRGGRALRGPEGPVTAATARRTDWLAPDVAVDAAALSPSLRQALAAHWEREAAFEHASVASFSQASLALLAVGAPPDLVVATHAAAIDEVEHARLAYALASAYGGAGRGPGSLSMAGVTGATTLASLARDTFLDGCAGEATAALALREGAATATDDAVRTLLERIAEDEERHAELAWRTVAWAIRAGGDEVASALRDAAATLVAELTEGDAPADPEGALDLTAHGALGDAARRTIRRRAIAEVVSPCAEALLATVGTQPAVERPSALA